MNKVLITGANGFVGSALAPWLASRGWWVRAAERMPEASAGSVQGVVETVRAQALGLSSDWSEALDGVEHVVHLAGWAGSVHPRLSVAETNGINVDGTIRLAEQCAALGVKRLVYLSTIKVFGEVSRKRPFLSSDEPSPQTLYARSKWEAERSLRQISARSSLEIVFIRAPLIYGPRVPGNFRRMLRLSHSGLPLPFASVCGKRSLLFVGNLCDLIELTLRSAAAAGKTLLASDGRDLTVGELIGLLGRGSQRPSRLFRCPTEVLRSCAVITGRRSLAEKLFDPLQVDVSATRDCLGWRPPSAVEDALAETASWYRTFVAGELTAQRSVFGGGDSARCSTPGS